MKLNGVNEKESRNYSSTSIKHIFTSYDWWFLKITYGIQKVLKLVLTKYEVKKFYLFSKDLGQWFQ